MFRMCDYADAYEKGRQDGYQQGLEDAAQIADVKHIKGGKPPNGLHHAGLRAGREESARLIRRHAEKP